MSATSGPVSTHGAATRPADTRGGGFAVTSEVLTPIVLLGLTVLMVIGSQSISPSLGGLGQVSAIVALSSFLMVVAFGQQMVVLIGGLDLSVPSLVTLGGILTFGWSTPSPFAVVFVILGVLLITAFIGALSGLALQCSESRLSS